MKPIYIIGIDPDVEKSGVAIVYTDIKRASVKSLNFSELIDWLRKLSTHETIGYKIVIEAGWKKSGNWHLKNSNSKRAAAIGNSTGRNHEVGRKIVEYAKHCGLTVVEQIPLQKHWNGPDKKITHAEITRFIPGLPKTTNQEERDALLIAWINAGFNL